MGNQLEVPPASQPWASCFLVTCQVAGESGTTEVHRSVAEPYEVHSPYPPSLSHMERTAGDQEQRGTGACAQRVNHTCPAPATALAAVPTNEAARVHGWEESTTYRRKGLGNVFRLINTFPASICYVLHPGVRHRVLRYPTIHSLLLSFLKEKHCLGDQGECMATQGSTGGYKQSDGACLVA